MLEAIEEQAKLEVADSNENISQQKRSEPSKEGSSAKQIDSAGP